MDILLKGGRLVDPAAGIDTVGDLMIRSGVVSEVGGKIDAGKARVVECAEKIVMPGLVDAHTHLREPGREDEETVESATRAAVHGGFTAVCAMPNTEPVADNGSAVRFLVERAQERGLCRVYPVGALTAGRKGESLAEIGDMVAEGAVAFSDDGNGVQSAGMMRLVMDYIKAFGKCVVSHAEDDSLVGKGCVNEGVVSTRLGLPGWPAAAEEAMVARDIRLAELTGCRLHFAHLSTAGSLELVRAARKRGVPVTCEVTPHHLFLSEEALLDASRPYDTALKTNPPLRTEEDRKALLKGLKDGTVDCIATDHAPHAPHEKELEFQLAPFGTTGLETALPLVNEQLVARRLLDWPRVVELMCHGPRACLGLPSAGLVKGAAADITIFDPEAQVVVRQEWFESKSRNSAFLGRKLLGKATEVVVDGRLVMQNGKVAS